MGFMTLYLMGVMVLFHPITPTSNANNKNTPDITLVIGSSSGSVFMLFLDELMVILPTELLPYRKGSVGLNELVVRCSDVPLSFESLYYLLY